ncbi:MAG: AlpA family phage regulatory protein [Rhizobiaceae bacterium]|nr:AlpA family phage regulatory protein [Rhizobiaceae bacterium]MCC0043910.1 AlpA family phage regulatory protein [Brucellaceae bacterium]
MHGNNSNIIDRLLKLSEVEHVTSIGCSGIYDLMKHPDPVLRFPAPVKIGHRSRWRESAVREWMARVAERSEAAA